MKRGSFTIILLGLFILIVIYVVLTLSRGRTTFFGRAAGEGVLMVENCYVLASPLAVRAGGDQIRVTVFALDGQGKGLKDKPVTVTCVDSQLCQSAGVVFNEIQGLTDALGQSIYDLSAKVPGKFELQAVVDSTPIPQTVTVAFQ